MEFLLDCRQREVARDVGQAYLHSNSNIVFWSVGEITGLCKM